MAIIFGALLPSLVKAAPNTPPLATAVLGQAGFTSNMEDFRQVNGHNFQSVEGLAVDEDETTKLQVKLSDKIRAITPGQSTVIYDGQYVVGGGIVV
ncbi:hypothetical protein KC968_04510 [Candidatus Saccharibacteria bacterium]|nr:hypothetical protein [Candidatus Saccharibacteria bacterium]